jgi:hypothetical protein
MATPTAYTFTQQVDYIDILTSNIQQSSIATALSYIGTDGTGSSMLVSVWFSDVLSDTDQTTLNSVMSSYINSLPTNQQQLNKILNDMNFGMQIIAQFGAANRSAGLTTAQVIQVSEQLAPIQSLLISGSIETAMTIIQGLTPNAFITQDIINNYVQQLQTYLSNE